MKKFHYFLSSQRYFPGISQEPKRFFQILEAVIADIWCSDLRTSKNSTLSSVSFSPRIPGLPSQ